MEATTLGTVKCEAFRASFIDLLCNSEQEWRVEVQVTIRIGPLCRYLKF